jgi:hypothetical protein
MDMKRHVLICSFISMLVDRKNEWNSYKMGLLLEKVGDNYLES